jgi:hypothetical protein
VSQFKNGHKGGPGRPKGLPNKATLRAREAIARMVDDTAPDFVRWMKDIDDPAKRCDVWLRAAEYHIPKLARTEVTGDGGGALVIRMSAADEAL